MFEKYPPEIRETLKKVYEEWLATSSEKTGISFSKFASEKLGYKYYKEILEIAEEIDKNRSKKKKSVVAAAFALATAVIIGLSKVMRAQED
ncbi:MAG: hypothetical protein ABGF52_03275 [Candidatus Asgardarchaeum sp.]|nr:hypothetical protein [Candidatus Odinarchaeota archaeon]